MIALLMVAALAQTPAPVFYPMGTFNGAEYRVAEVEPRAGIFWLRYERMTGERQDRVYDLVQVQCLDREYRGLHTVWVMGEGENATTFETLPVENWDAPRPGSAEAGLVALYCDEMGGT